MPLLNNARHRGTGRTLLPAATGTRSCHCSVRPRGSIRQPRCSQGGRSGVVCPVVLEEPWGRGHLRAPWGHQLWGGLGELSSPPQALGCGWSWVPAPQGEIQPRAHCGGCLLGLQWEHFSPSPAPSCVFCGFFSQLCRERLEAAGLVPSLPPSSFVRSHPSWHEQAHRQPCRHSVHTAPANTRGGTRGPNCVRCHHPAPPPICRGTEPPAPKPLPWTGWGHPVHPHPTGRQEPNARGQPIGESTAEGSW